jgi:hypothetical protein
MSGGMQREAENNEANDQDYQNMCAVDSMVRTAIKAGVHIDVVLAFANYIKNGDSIQEAARCALYDWDC